MEVLSYTLRGKKLVGGDEERGKSAPCLLSSAVIIPHSSSTHTSSPMLKLRAILCRVSRSNVRSSQGLERIKLHRFAFDFGNTWQILRILGNGKQKDDIEAYIFI